MGNTYSQPFLITDTHFCHDRITTDFGFRPQNFERNVISQWKAAVREQDIVFHLGDVTWGTHEHLKEIMQKLPGNKILIRGNHDKKHSNNWFIQAGFSAVLDRAQLSGVILSHKPIKMSKEEKDKGIINIHGHFHNVSASRWEKELVDNITENHYLLSLELVDYKPILLSKAIRRKYVINSSEQVKKVKGKNYDK